MKFVELAGSGERLSVLSIGAQSGDIEIGAGATGNDPQLDRTRR